jgi:cysteine desulfurase / selenocysteine lyase
MATLKTEDQVAFDIAKVRRDFPLLNRQVYGKQLVYLDNGATSQKPKAVLDAIDKYYTQQNSNIHRGVHFLSQDATMAYEKARETIQKHIQAKHSHEVIFTKGATDAINLVAYSFGKAFLKPGDEVLITEMEHHSNIVPWQIACEDRGAILKVLPMDDKGELMLSELDRLLTPRTKLLSFVHVSNTLGTINPVRYIIDKAHEVGSKVLIDGCQAIQHLAVDVQELDVDFYVFSGHKVFGPTGTGILYGKEELLNAMPPYQGGGDMIKTVTFEKTVYNDLPHKFEAGTPHIEGGIALAVAFDYINEIGLENIHAYEQDLLTYATDQLTQIPGLEIWGRAQEKASVISFNIKGLHPFDVGTILDKMGIAVRTGHHCTQPIMDKYCIPGTVRASLAFYNTKEEIDKLVIGVNKAIQMLS